MAEKLQICLELGEMVQQHGGPTDRTIDTVRRMAAALGFDSSYVAVSSLNVTMSGTQGGRTLTAIHHASHFGVNFRALTDVKHLVSRTEAGQTDLAEIRTEIARIRSAPPEYPRWLVLLCLGAATAAFAALFRASATMVALCFLGGWAGATVRARLTDRHLLPFVTVTSAAFAAAFVIAALGRALGHGSELAPALAASTLFLVPGVPMLNGTTDELTGNYLNGLVRLAMAAVIVLSAAVGLGVAVWASGARP